MHYSNLHHYHFNLLPQLLSKTMKQDYYDVSKFKLQYFVDVCMRPCKFVGEGVTFPLKIGCSGLEVA